MQTPPIEPDTVVVRSPHPLAARVDDEILMLDVRQGSYFGLDRTGAATWELLDEPRSVATVCATLASRYDVAPDVCRAEVIAFLTELSGAGLVEVVGTAAH